MLIQCVHGDNAAEEEWDQFLISSPRGSATQLSTWLRGFHVYGFSHHVIVVRESPGSRIVGGVGLLEAGRWPFNAIVSSFGPILEEGYEHLVRPIVEEAIALTRARRAFLLQVRVPVAKQVVDPALLGAVELPTCDGHARGRPFELFTGPNFMLLVDLPDEKDDHRWQEALLAQVSKSTRRDIKKSWTQGLVLGQPTDGESLRQAYALVERNGRELGYQTRTWSQFGPTLIEQVAKGHGVVLTASLNGELVGIHFGLVGGRRYFYAMGGTVRTTPDRLVGHFLHWNALLKARSLGLQRYDMSSGGSPGVMRFKMSFRPVHIELEEAHYYNLGAWRFSAFRRLWPVARRNKAVIAKLLQVARKALRSRAP
jgi:hypothetical protein